MLVDTQSHVGPQKEPSRRTKKSGISTRSGALPVSFDDGSENAYFQGKVVRCKPEASSRMKALSMAYTFDNAPLIDAM